MVSFCVGALVVCDALRVLLPFFAFTCLFCFSLSVLRLCTSFSPIRCCFLYFLPFFAVVIPSPCVSVSCTVPFFRGPLVFFSCLLRVFSLLFVRCRWGLFPGSLVLGSGFCSPSASFGSLVPFPTWSPFGTSQGLMFPLYRSVFLFHSRIGLPLGHLSVPFSYDSFESAVPVAQWSPFGISQCFAGSSVSLASQGSHSLVVSLRGRVSFSSLLCLLRLRLPPSGVSPFGVPRDFRLSLSLVLFSAFISSGLHLFVHVLFGCHFRLFGLFPWCLSAIGGLGLRSEFPSRVVLCPCSSSSAFVRSCSSLPCFGIFLPCVHFLLPCGSSSSGSLRVLLLRTASFGSKFP